MKDYSEFFIGNRVSKYDEQDCADVFSKKDIDCFFCDIYDKIVELNPATINDEYDEDSKKEPIEIVFKLGYAQAKREILTLLDNEEISILNHADEFLDMEDDDDE